MPEDRLVVGWLGSDPNQSSVNDVLIISSDDGGRTWSEPQTIFLSGQQPGRMLQLCATPDGQLHLVWGRQTAGLPVPNEIWHSLSIDGGSTWSEPERIIRLEKSPDISRHYFTDFKIASDSYGRIHLTGVEAKIYKSGETQNPILYSSWSPTERQWKDFTELGFGNYPAANISLSMDETENELYLFWNDEYKEEGRALFYSKKPIEKPVLPSFPVVGESGPLKLHPNYPNPFNSSTTIPFTLDEPAEVIVRVYDVTGRQVLQQDLGLKSAEIHHQKINLNGMASGIYICEITVDDIWRRQQKITFVK